MGSSEMALDNSVIDPRRLMAELARAFTDTARERGIDLRIEGEAPKISADHHLLRRALANLLDNAVRYAPREDTVHLETSANSREVLIAVSNTGYLPLR